MERDATRETDSRGPSSISGGGRKSRSDATRTGPERIAHRREESRQVLRKTSERNIFPAFRRVQIYISLARKFKFTKSEVRSGAWDRRESRRARESQRGKNDTRYTPGGGIR